MTKRCFWVNLDNPLYVAYHDEEWGVPVYEDRKLFEFLILEGAQAGLSWETVLNKRAHYSKVFHQFDPKKVAAMSDEELTALLTDPGIIRNKLKVFSARRNARVFLEIQEEFGGFSDYLWSFVDGTPIVKRYRDPSQMPVTTPESDALSKDLKKRGMSFVGSTIMYAYMQAVGLFDDHMEGCFRANSNA